MCTGVLRVTIYRQFVYDVYSVSAVCLDIFQLAHLVCRVIFGPGNTSVVVVVVVVGISSLKVPKAFLNRSATKLCIHIRAHIHHRSTISDFLIIF